MKISYNIYLILIALCSTLLIQAQDKIWVGPSAGSWGVAEHWSPVGVPGPINDVIIPPNTWITVDVTAFMDELSVLEGAIVDKTTDLAMTMSGGNFAFTSTLNFEAGNINNGNTNGGLFFEGEVNVIGPERKRFSGNVTINNVINLGTNVFDFNLRSNTLLIAPGATMNTEDGSIAIEAFTATLRNEGTINKLVGSGTFTIDTVFENDGGTMNVNTGSMLISNSSTLTDGQYNVNSAGFLELGGNNFHFINGTLSGQLNGPFIFNSPFRVSNNAENFLDFSGPAGVEWRSSALSAQAAAGTILVNKGLLEIIDTGGPATQISGGAILRNEGNIIIREGLFFTINNVSTLNNNELGTITIEQDVNIGGGTFINTGLIETDLDTGDAIVRNLINNTPGVLNINVGNVAFPTSYAGDGIITGDGSISTLPSTDIAGTIAPGVNGIGTLDYNNNSEFDSTEETIYQIEIDGTTPDTEHDVFAINANAKLNGTLDVILGFEPELNDEFVIITATAVTECNLPAQVISIFNGNAYTYDVVCNPDNVTLRVNDISLSVDDNVLTNASMYPNPTSGDLKIEFGQMQSELNTTISNILGQVITYERFVNTDTIDLTIDGSPGIYFVTIDTSNGNQKTFKVIKN